MKRVYTTIKIIILSLSIMINYGCSKEDNLTDDITNESIEDNSALLSLDDKSQYSHICGVNNDFSSRDSHRASSEGVSPFTKPAVNSVSRLFGPDEVSDIKVFSNLPSTFMVDWNTYVNQAINAWNSTGTCLNFRRVQDIAIADIIIRDADAANIAIGSTFPDSHFGRELRPTQDHPMYQGSHHSNIY